MAATYLDVGVKWLLNRLNFGLRARLFKNDVTPSGTTILANLTQADFDGYAEVTVSEGTADAEDGVAFNVLTPSAVFTRATTGTTQNIYGYYVTDAGNSILYFAERFGDAPVAMTDADDRITVVFEKFYTIGYAVTIFGNSTIQIDFSAIVPGDLP